MSGLDRYLAVLVLFTESKSTWNVQEISVTLNVPTSTVYRTIRDLARANMISPATEGCYRLGAAFAEFDRRTRLTDPLIRLGVPVLSEVVREAGIPCVAVLARLYGDTVMCVADIRSKDSTVETSYERGRPRPLALGATSKAILAQLSSHRLKKLLIGMQDAMGPDALAELRAELSRIRKSGHSVTHGEVDRGRVGVAVPISVPEQGLAASLSLVLNETSFDTGVEARLLDLLESSAARLQQELSLARPMHSPPCSGWHDAVRTLRRNRRLPPA